MADEKVPDHPVDKVQMVSRHPDGTPAQGPGYEIIGDKETAERLNAEQLKQQYISAYDQRDRAVAPAEEEKVLSDEEKTRLEAHESLAKKAEEHAKSLVDDKHTSNSQDNNSSKSAAGRRADGVETTARRQGH